MPTRDVLQGRYVAAIHRLLRGARRPTGRSSLVCEDIHWADPASIDVAAPADAARRAAARSCSSARCAPRPDSPGWALVGQARELFGDALTEIRLEPLTEAESRELVANLLEIESLPRSRARPDPARAEGNPFFVEEVVRMLIDRGAIVREGDRWVATDEVERDRDPGDAARAAAGPDRPAARSAKRSLRIAAVIGRQFPVRVLERVLGEATAMIGEPTDDRPTPSSTRSRRRA